MPKQQRLEDVMKYPPESTINHAALFANDATADLLADLSLFERRHIMSLPQNSEKFILLEKFLKWSEVEQIEFVKSVLHLMCHAQHGEINSFLQPILQRDFITLLPPMISSHILSYVDAKTLCSCESVSYSWKRKIALNAHWKKLVEQNIRDEAVWRGIAEKRKWLRFFIKNKKIAKLMIQKEKGYVEPNYDSSLKSLDAYCLENQFYKELFARISSEVKHLERNWRTGNHVLSRINCNSEQSKGVYCLQYDDEKIISGLRDNTIKIWRRDTLQCDKVLHGHTGSVLCLQFDLKTIVSGSSDSTVRIWDINTGENVNVLMHHSDAVLHLRFWNKMIVTCSKDRSVAVWDMKSPAIITLRQVLIGHRAAVNVVDFDDKYIVSASGDRTIKIWNTKTCEFVRTLTGHERGIACLHYRENLIASGSSDNTIRLWDIESGACLRVLTGHEELVRCIRFDSKRIISGAYDGKIKIWDMKAALDPETPLAHVHLLTLNEHSGRVFRLQFDDFIIVSSSHDDTILIWDFLNSQVDAPQNADTAQEQNVQNVIVDVERAPDEDMRGDETDSVGDELPNEL